MIGFRKITSSNAANEVTDTDHIDDSKTMRGKVAVEPNIIGVPKHHTTDYSVFVKDKHLYNGLIRL